MATRQETEEGRIAGLRAEERALYGRLESESTAVEKLYRQGKTREAITREDLWLADLALYEITVDERRALEGK